MTLFCCKAFAHEVAEHNGLAGGEGLYPPELHPTGQIEPDPDGTWNINGCCGGGCYVITGMKFCPFCGTALRGCVVFRPVQKVPL